MTMALKITLTSLSHLEISSLIFLKLSLKEKFYCIQEPLAFYRHHDTNFSKKTNLFASEMDHWIEKNSYKFKKLNYSLKRFKFNYYKLKLKQLIGWGP